ncbi:FUSC family protein [Arthrobacter alpinus]|uniref:FUSC family protein n=1 Tax=Arthrobacter alpinus TaxID=656366 RepID=UPI000A9AB3C9|nr:FUSC family protein [Arthrobacter alpinus]
MSVFRVWAKSTVNGQRVLLSIKAALAVGIAWFLAPHMPGVADKYPYYAPLGALVSMYPTFIGSVRTGFQTLLGLLLGIGVGGGVLLLGHPNIVTISLAVGLGVLLAGSPRLGAGREYVPVATLLVLIIDGQSGVDAFSVGYAVQMGMGVLVGLAVNVAIFPPLTHGAALAQISRGREVLIRQLQDMAKALVEQWPPEHEEWAARGYALEDSVSEIRGAVHEARESHRANPRGLLRATHRVVSEGYNDLAVLEVITFHIRDLSEVLAAAIWGTPLDVALDTELCGPLSNCMEATAGVLLAWEENTKVQDAFEAAQRRLANFTTVLAARESNDVPSLEPGVAIALDIQRILAALQQRLLASETGLIPE